MNNTIKKAGAIAVLSVAVLGGSVATAAFTSEGGFWAQGHLDRLAQPEVSATVVGTMLPGESSDVRITVRNPNRVRVEGDVAVSANVRGTCASLITNRPGNVTQISIPADSTKTITIHDGLKLADNAGDACQGAEFESLAWARFSYGS